MKRRNSTSLIAALLIVGPWVVSEARADGIRINGFGDMSYGVNFGGRADQDAFDRYEGTVPLNSLNGFGIVGADFVILAPLGDKATFLTEINFQTLRSESDEVEIDPERFFLNYEFSDKLQIGAGLFFTPIGYHNRFQYSRAWMMRSVQVPNLWEEELNLVPTHTVGVMAHGTLPLSGENSVNYAVSLGNGRAATPDAIVYTRDPDVHPEIAAVAEFNFADFKEFRIGLSGWTSNIETFGVDQIGDSIAIDAAPELQLREIGANPYIVYNEGPVGLSLEYVLGYQRTISGNSPNTNSFLHGAMAEVFLNLHEDTLHPYVRYDFFKLPGTEQGPYYGLRTEDGQVTKIFIPERNAIMGGVAYDLNLNMRLKLEYTYRLEGADKAQAILAQAAFGF